MRTLTPATGLRPFVGDPKVPADIRSYKCMVVDPDCQGVKLPTLFDMVFGSVREIVPELWRSWSEALDIGLGWDEEMEIACIFQRPAEPGTEVSTGVSPIDDELLAKEIELGAKLLAFDRYLEERDR